MIFEKTLQKMLKRDLTLQIINQIDHCLKENKNDFGLMKDKLRGEIVIKVVGLKRMVT